MSTYQREMRHFPIAGSYTAAQFVGGANAVGSRKVLLQWWVAFVRLLDTPPTIRGLRDVEVAAAGHDRIHDDATHAFDRCRVMAKACGRRRVKRWLARASREHRGYAARHRNRHDLAELKAVGFLMSDYRDTGHRPTPRYELPKPPPWLTPLTQGWGRRVGR